MGEFVPAAKHTGIIHRIILTANKRLIEKTASFLLADMEP
jgi:hypothetical protein